MCVHPDPKTLSELWCRHCGYWKDGIRIGEPTAYKLKEIMHRIQSDEDELILEPRN